MRFGGGENACQSAGLGIVAIPAVRERATETGRSGSIAPRGLPQRQHAVQAQAIDRLRNAGLLDWPRDRAEAERVARNRCSSWQESQGAETRRRFVVEHRQTGL